MRSAAQGDGGMPDWALGLLVSFTCTALGAVGSVLIQAVWRAVHG